MANVDGTWDVVTKTPMGEQRATLIIATQGSIFTGTLQSAMITVELENGTIRGDTLYWTMQLTVPMRMSLEGTATIAGDTLTGHLKAGIFGSSPMTGTRVA